MILELISAIFMKGTSHQEIKIFPSQQKKKYHFQYNSVNQIES